MRSLARNQKKIYYANFVSSEPIVDEYGNLTGEVNSEYTEPTEYYANVSAARGIYELEQFGTNANYTRTITTTDMTCPINENSRLWIDAPTSASHDYVVTMVAKSINSITYAVLKVDTQ